MRGSHSDGYEDMTSRSLGTEVATFRENLLPISYISLMMERVRSSETSMNLYLTTCSHIPEAITCHTLGSPKGGDRCSKCDSELLPNSRPSAQQNCPINNAVGAYDLAYSWEQIKCLLYTLYKNFGEAVLSLTLSRPFKAQWSLHAPPLLILYIFHVSQSVCT
jgi:hypothetical protein